MNRKSKVIIILFISISLVGCANYKNKEIVVLVDELFQSIKDQDYKKIDNFMPNSELVNVLMEDKESVDNYMENIDWRVGKINEVDGKYVANVLVNTIDIKSLDGIDTGVNIPRLSMEDLKNGDKIDMELKLSFKKIDNEYILIYDEYTYKDIIDTISGGGYFYVRDVFKNR